ncbi:MAG: hypothetical protein R6V58_05780 [Planctomycetota bacterium]
MIERHVAADHDEMVKMVALTLELNGFLQVKAELEGYPEPGRIVWRRNGEGFAPDVTADGGRLELFEVETDDSLYEPCTADKLNLFSRFARQHAAGFTVVVPRGWRAVAKKRLQNLGLDGAVWEM